MAGILEQLIAADTGGELFEHFNHPGSDIVIDGVEYQIKATDSTSYINSVADDIPVISTSEVASETAVSRPQCPHDDAVDFQIIFLNVFKKPSGFSNNLSLLSKFSKLSISDRLKNKQFLALGCAGFLLCLDGYYCL